MRRLRVNATALIVLGLLGLAYSSPRLVSYQNLQPVAAKSISVQPKASRPPQPVTLGHSEPTELRINKINLDAPITAVGLNADKTLAVPGPHDVGWYDGGPTPGEKGPAVLVGHVDYIDDIAVFWHLRELAPGDTFQVIRADGLTANFRVDSVQQFADTNFPTQAVYGPLNYAGIRLITCGGTFNTTTRHYDQNTIVFGTMTNPTNGT